MHDKGPVSQKHNGAGLRVGIVHARWNPAIIDPLVAGAKAQLLESGVAEANIIVESVPGAWELPVAVQRQVKDPGTISLSPPFPTHQCDIFFSASQIQSASSADPVSAGDLLLGGSTPDLSAPAASGASSAASTQQFDAIIAIGVLIKGETMHFEYIADSVSQGLMRVQLDTGVPVIFGLLTVLNEKQGLARAGVVEGSHNHGEDWGSAAVEMAVKRKAWAAGKLN